MGLAAPSRHAERAGLVDHRKYAASLAAEGRFDEAADLLDRYADADGEGAIAAPA